MVNSFYIIQNIILSIYLFKMVFQGRERICLFKIVSLVGIGNALREGERGRESLECENSKASLYYFARDANGIIFL